MAILLLRQNSKLNLNNSQRTEKNRLSLSSNRIQRQSLFINKHINISRQIHKPHFR